MRWDVMLELEHEAPVFADLVARGRARTALKILDRVVLDSVDDDLREWARRIRALVAMVASAAHAATSA